MSANLAFDFSVDKEKKIITIKREFAAERSLVWDAYTRSEILDQWWAPKPWRAKTIKMDFREGGRWEYAMVGPKGEEHRALLNYLTIQSQKGFTAMDAFADEAGKVNMNMPQSNWTVSFSDKGQNTLVDSTVRYADLAHLEMILRMGFKEGLTMAMENLDALLPSLKK